MKFNMRKNLIGVLTTELTIDAMESRGFLHITDNNNVLCAGDDWQGVVAPLWISNELIGAARIDRSTDDALLGRVKVFRVKDLTWQNENPDFDDHKTVAQVEFLLPGGFERTEENLLANSYGSANDEFARAILNDLIVRTGAEVL